ncbi:MAG: alkaline phosphatase D family protein, partial [Dehalococcoidia bacterium]
ERSMVSRWVGLLFLPVSLAALAAGCGEEDEEGTPAATPTPTAAVTATVTPTPSEVAFTHGVASGDVTDTGVILWTRVDAEAEITVEVALDDQFKQVGATGKLQAKAKDDFVVTLAIEDLDPDSTYFYRFLSPDGTASPTGTFVTAPAQDVTSDVVFAYSGDSADYLQPFTLLTTVRQDAPDFFIYLGDTVIADPEVEGMSHATTLPQYRQLYKNNREDEHLLELLAATSTYAIWDDHEVVNDFAGETVDPDMMAAGLQAFFEYMPIRRIPTDPNRLYRSFRWGKDVELFILDERQYRTAEAFCYDEEGETEQFPTRIGDVACEEALRDPSRTMLGTEQKEWFKQALLDSDAKFKFIINEVPMSEFLLLPYDRWEGYPAEREELLNFITDNGIENVIFLTTDLHGAVVNTLENGSLEIITGPIARETIGEELENLEVSIELLEGLLPGITDEFYELDTYNYGLVKVLTSETPAKVVIEIKDGDGNLMHTVEIPEE